MSHVELLYTKSAFRDLKRLDKHMALRIVAEIKERSDMPNPLQSAKALHGSLAGWYRYRIGNYRAIFSFDAGTIRVLTVLRIRHRKDVYRN